MTTYILLLRGVMPTGKNKVPMALLRAALETAGLKKVRTYIQSGNVIVSTGLKQAALEQRVHQVIAEQFGGDIAVLAREAPYFQQILQAVPFDHADPKKLYFTMLSSAPDPALLSAFIATDHSPEKVVVASDMVYVLYATRYSDSKLNNNTIERKLKVSATTRVYNTMANLALLGQGSS
jgi:uncharacterized protein (DUF1697 family)